MATREQWKLVQEVFDRLRDAPPAEREQQLLEIADTDSNLADDVCSLLRDYDAADADFLTPPPAPDFEGVPLPLPSDGNEEDPLLGQQVGAFCVVDLIARGGMGSVYRVQQEHPKRTVALKLLHADYVTRPVRARFDYETAILARMQHPNIAQIYHAGTHAERPYFAMEYVENAQWITAYARDKDLSLNDRLLLFSDLCEAVQYGHRRGVIHRDLKPANVLVDGEGRLKVIDFGVARITDTDMTLVTRQTEAGQVIGTLQYMSPEQCAADPHEIDVRSDVYALGVILYELLCGQLPYDLKAASLPSAIRVVCETPPARPSLVRGAVRGDLEHILLTALEKDPRARYQSVTELQRDIRHNLAKEPIEARKPTAWTRAIRWVGRHPLWATTIACLLVAVSTIVATFISVWLLYVRPHDVVFDADQKLVRVVSLNDNPLHQWSNATSSETIERQADLGGGRLAVVGFAQHADAPFTSSLCAFSYVGDLRDPVWSVRIEDDELPKLYRQERHYSWRQFSSRVLLVADIFGDPSHPGNEIVVSHQMSPASLCAVRVYSANGECLYHMWQDGTIKWAYWMSDPGLLVFSGNRATLPWEARGVVDLPASAGSAHPYILYALRPRLGYRNRDGLSEQPRSGPEEHPDHPVWLKCIWPPYDADGAVVLSTRCDPPQFGDPRASVRTAWLVDRLTNAHVSWDVDATGQEIPGSRNAGDAYLRNRKRLTDSNTFKLVPLPRPSNPAWSEDPPRFTPREFWGNQP